MIDYFVLHFFKQLNLGGPPVSGVGGALSWYLPLGAVGTRSPLIGQPFQGQAGLEVCSLVKDQFPIMCKALGSIPISSQNKQHTCRQTTREDTRRTGKNIRGVGGGCEPSNL